MHFKTYQATFIFCLPNCSCNYEDGITSESNDSISELVQAGYMPCQTCQPIRNTSEMPSNIEALCLYMLERPQAKLSNDDLEKLNYDLKHVKVWFQENIGLTFHTLHRLYRINYAFQQIMLNPKHKGFEYLKKKKENNRTSKSILIDRLPTPLGTMLVCATQNGICLLEFTNRKMLETELLDLQTRLQAKICNHSSNQPQAQQHIQKLRKELKAYFEKELEAFSVPLDTVGTDFQKLVWKELQNISYGTTVTYGQQAKNIENPKAVRAVASANSYNKIAIVIPCHRVIGADGKLVGYAGGLHRKKWLLDHENEIKQD